MTFKELGVIDPILKSLEQKGYTHPTPIQEKSIPILLQGKDLLGCAQTGTGKTAAFAIPIIQLLQEQRPEPKKQRAIKAIILSPTRELALQIEENFTAYAKYTDVKSTVIFGGVKQGAQTQALQRGVDILIATPGRLLDLMNQGFIRLDNVQISVLDEADHMLDMGFIHDINKIVGKLPRKRQSLFFSATMPPEIVKLSSQILGTPERVTISPEKPTADRVDQSVYFVPKKNKSKLLIHLLNEQDNESTLVFSRTKHGANKIVKTLDKSGITAEPIHGNKSQAARQKALSNFKSGKTRVLVATDIAARGIDVSELPLVINHDLPNVAETYVHRIGRTGRAAASGRAISFCDSEEKSFLNDIKKLIGNQTMEVIEHPYSSFEPDNNSQQTGSKPQNQNRPPRKKNNFRRRNSGNN